MIQPMPTNAENLHLVTSDRLEILADRLAEQLRRPLSSPFVPEVVVVQSRGMEQWLRLGLASRLGVCANVRFPFPRAFVFDLFRRWVPGIPEEKAIDAHVLVWRVMRAFGEVLEQPGFELLRRYLRAGESEARRRVQLAGVIADLFDQYLVFRPELARRWSAGEDGDWQAILWRAVWGRQRPPHPGLYLAELQQRLRGGGAAPGALPERVSMFGISALPRFYLQVLAVLAEWVPVHLYLLQPSREYWGQVTSPREQERILRRLPRHTEPFAAHLESGNRLLASLGHLGRDFLELVLEAGDWQSEECFSEETAQADHDEVRRMTSAATRFAGGEQVPSGTGREAEVRGRAGAESGSPQRTESREETTLLRQIQLDILHLRDRGVDPAYPALELPDDDSVRVHSCHSPLRELEVLRDHLLDWFRREPDLLPSDIVVMTPDLETYAPLVPAVFGGAEDERQRIPWRVADRVPGEGDRVVSAFLEMLALERGRGAAPEVLSLLEAPAVRRRFGMAESDVERVRDWVQAVGIRWGIDAAHRGRLGVPECAGNTWREGLDRLLLGCAMAEGENRVFDGVAPFDVAEGETTVVLGRFVEFVERCFAWVEELERSRNLAAWADTLQRLADEFLLPGAEGVGELGQLRAVLGELREQAAASGYEEPMPLEAIAERLRPALAEDRRGTGFLRGMVTFCGLKPMRSLPFPVICLVGMNDGSFPRADRRPSFDRMADRPELGDRSNRQDDRYLFLETLLSARRRLHVSYVGRSIRDNRPIPPSVVVGELLDYVGGAFRLPGEMDAVDHRRQVQERFVMVHRLQAFHPDYYRGASDRWFSYSRQNCLENPDTGIPTEAERRGLLGALGEPGAEHRTVTLEDLARFFANPARQFLERRLRLFLRQPGAGLESSEPFLLEGLDAYRVRAALLERAVERVEEGMAAAGAVVRARGLLPLEAMGEVTYRKVAREVTVFAGQLRDAGIRTRGLESSPVDLTVGTYRLSGSVPRSPGAGVTRVRCGSVRAVDQLRLWIEHLAWQAAGGLAAPAQLVGWERVSSPKEKEFPVGLRRFVFLPVAEAGARLQELLEVYGKGMRSVLRFFPETSLAYAEVWRKLGPSEAAGSRALAAAGRKWSRMGGFGGPGEEEDLHFRYCFRGLEVLDKEFAALALAVYGPLLDHRREET